MLVLLNGPPASGKSTLAARLVESRPLALNLDIDVVRGLLGAWIDRPADAGLAARALAISMARTHLAAGHDVFVPQFLGRVDFIEELERLADECDVRFVEIASSSTAARRSRRSRNEAERRRRSPMSTPPSSSNDPARSTRWRDMYDAFSAMLEQRPNARRVDVEIGDIDGTLGRLERAIGQD